MARSRQRKNSSGPSASFTSKPKLAPRTKTRWPVIRVRIEVCQYLGWGKGNHYRLWRTVASRTLMTDARTVAFGTLVRTLEAIFGYQSLTDDEIKAKEEQAIEGLLAGEAPGANLIARYVPPGKKTS